MSLINDMLKDLEARGASPSRGGGVRTPAASPRRRTRWLAGGLALLLVGIVAVAGALIGLPSLPDATTPPALAATSPKRATPQPDETGATDAKAAAATPLAPSGAAETVVAFTDMNTDAATSNAGAGKAPQAAAEPRDAAPSAPADSKADPQPASEPVSEAPPASHDDAQTLIVRRHEPTPEERALRAGREGFAALARHDWLAASRLLGEVVALQPANDDAREGLVVALTRQGRLAEAEGVLLDGLAVGVEPARFAQLRARLQVARDDLAGALDSLSIAVPDVANDPQYHALRAAIAQQAGEHALAAATYRELTSLEPGNATWQAGLGMALDALNQPVEARAAYERALEAGGLEPALLQHVRQRLAAPGSQ